jgi:hypothetical protein
METRLEIDQTDDIDELKRINQVNDAQIEETIKSLTKILAINNDDIHELEREIVKLKYLYTIREACNDKIC